MKNKAAKFDTKTLLESSEIARERNAKLALQFQEANAALQAELTVTAQSAIDTHVHSSEAIERLSAAAHEGWRKQYQVSGRHDTDFLDVPYDQLTEEWKDYDRATAKMMQPIIDAKLQAMQTELDELRKPLEYLNKLQAGILKLEAENAALRTELADLRVGSDARGCISHESE